MNIIQYLLLLLVLFAIYRIWLRWRQHDISRVEWLVWSLFWLLAGLAILWPKTTDLVAGKLGLASGRGVDLVVYISIPLLFYILFRLVVKIDNLEQNLTKIIRHLAIQNKQDQDKEKK